MSYELSVLTQPLITFLLTPNTLHFFLYPIIEQSLVYLVSVFKVRKYFKSALP